MERLFLTLPTNWDPHFLQHAKSDSCYFIFIYANICKYSLFPNSSDLRHTVFISTFWKEVTCLAFSSIVYEITQPYGSHSKNHKRLDLCFTKHKAEMKS